MGIDFGDLEEDLADESYPLTTAEVVDEYGDRELEHASGTTTVREALSGVGEETFDGRDAVHQTILDMVGTEAIGRDRYSDRGGDAAADDEVDEEQDSL